MMPPKFMAHNAYPDFSKASGPVNFIFRDALGPSYLFY